MANTATSEPVLPMLWGTKTSSGPGGVGSANLDWESLGFEYIPTNGHVVYKWKDGKWDTGRFARDPYLTVHILANVFHYGQAIYEGFKAFHTVDGSVQTFVDHLCHERMSHGCRRFQMPTVPEEVWRSAIDEVIRQSASFVPPYGTGGSMYVRPFMFGSGPKLGLGPSSEYTFAVFANPVGSYYKAGAMLDGLVSDAYDRAAPLGSGDVKCAGNYAADLESIVTAKKAGYPISLYLDAGERRYVEEFNTSNFVAITKAGEYLTPEAPRSILRSNTNRVLMTLAKDMGVSVQQRRIDFDAEVASFAEVGAVGTAVVVTPISSLKRGDKVWKFQAPDLLQKLRSTVRAIQVGEVEDKHGWTHKVAIVDKQQQAIHSIYPPL
eukprot:CAMPEP_0178420556 /NCGR_PEP_ID=MMETSP0689_2-20121128/26193_1 /TAXON_ID=160604 /ORGANISM="Amphidinium massartii, Strain CS-259" /LENGTH=378 /DNA_ID=CAMNT_0020042041 /DNA_START=248 /DNA_END=1384 /DNA_ORIENTATION=+